MISLYEHLAVWSSRNSGLLAVVAIVSLPGAIILTFTLNFLIVPSSVNYALILYATAPFGIWSLGCLLSRLWFAKGINTPREGIAVKILRGFEAIFLTLWMLSPIAILAVIAS